MIESLETKIENKIRDCRGEIGEFELKLKELVNEDKVAEIISYNLADFKI